MKKVSKFILASSLILGFSVTPGLFNVTQAHAQESVKPYYNYSGYTAHQSNFILDKNFKTSLKADNFKINGYKITQNESAKMIKMYMIKHITGFLIIKRMVFSSH